MGQELQGIIVPLVTPFMDDESLDETGLRALVSFLIERGVHGLFPAGSQGEFYALSSAEQRRTAEVVIEEAAGRVPVIPNAGAITTREAIALARYARDAGADAVSVITPFFIKPTQAELQDHFVAVARSVDIPVLLYNNPGRTGVNLLPETVARIVIEAPNVAGIKDSSGDLTQTLDYARLSPGLRTFVGRDTIIFPALVAGCVGAVAATANVVPELVVGIYRAVQAGDHARARELQQRLVPLRNAFSLGSFPVVVKEALRMLDLPAGPARRPITPLAPAALEDLRGILRDLGFSL